MTYCVFDVETTYGTDFGRPSNPFLEKNELVACAVKEYNKSSKVYRSTIPQEIFKSRWLIGHNIKFDLLWIMRYRLNEFKSWLINGGKIWDTMLVDYMLHGHLKIGYSLDAVARRRGGTLKDDRIKTMWNAGIQTKDIPEEILNEYVKNDVLNTELIALQQMRECKEQDILELVEIHNRCILFTLFCEHSGMRIDKELAEKIKLDLQEEQAAHKNNLEKLIKSQVPEKYYSIFNLNSVDHLSAILYGGKLKTKESLPILLDGKEQYYKTGDKAGQVKTKITEIEVPIKGFGLDKAEELKGKKEGVYKTGFRVLVKQRGIQFIDTLLKYRKTSKLLSTYVDDEGNSVVGLTHPDGMVHGNFNHCITATGRLSSNRPNLQNIEKKSPLKSIFTSRFTGGKLVQFDFSQLEIKTQGFLTQDLTVLEDIKNGVDFYCKLLAEVEGISYDECKKLSKTLEIPEWVDKRQKFKSVRLGMNYGMGMAKCAAETELDFSDVEAIFSAVERLYPGVKAFNTSVYEKIKSNRVVKFGGIVYTFKTDNNMPALIGQWRDPLKGIYNFIQYDAPEYMIKNGIYKTFSPTQAKNFPNQGLAAHIVSLGAGLILHKILPHVNYILPINTVHDSYVLDCHPDYINKCVDILQQVSNDLPKIISERFNVDFNVPLNGEISVGSNWRDMETIK